MLDMFITNDFHKPENRNKMAGLLDRRDNNHVFSHQFMKSNFAPRAPTPPQNGDSEVDDAGSMEYRFEEVRLRSFENWPNSSIRPEDLASAGFYYTKQIDRVRCFECGTEICRWEEGDNPMSEHQRWGGRCRFIRKLPCGNVPIGADASTIPVPQPRSRDVCGLYSLDYRMGAEADTHASSSRQAQQQNMPSIARLGCLGIGIAKKPDYPDLASYEARLKTFANWPPSIHLTKEELADAGFFYEGTGDHCICYHCGGGLKNWEPQDDAWTQHAKWFSACFYVRLVKGQEFINNVTGKHVPPLSEEETMQLNLPSCFKKVESPPPQKPKDETPEEQTGVATPVASAETTAAAAAAAAAATVAAAGPSNTVCPIPKPRTSTTEELQKEVMTPTETVKCASSEEQKQPCEKKSIDDARVCKICYNEELGVVFLPCGHIVACVKCAPGMTTCAVCREPVSMTVRAFFS